MKSILLVITFVGTALSTFVVLLLIMAIDMNNFGYGPWMGSARAGNLVLLGCPPIVALVVTVILGKGPEQPRPRRLTQAELDEWQEQKSGK